MNTGRAELILLPSNLYRNLSDWEMRCRSAATIQRLYKHALPLQNFAALTQTTITTYKPMLSYIFIRTFLVNSPSKVSPTCHVWRSPGGEFTRHCLACSQTQTR
ncbi:hypothetical protein V6N12_010670 [Hibiscus sabdariffa]|uniref:Uncharacterized protein n=1 Tax=Hibiscus sabdariffa TaxID=183260 RepID=A0ABR2EL31_9ROSI